MADDVVMRASISSALAERILDAAVAKAGELGKPFTIAVVDESGVLHLSSHDRGILHLPGNVRYEPPAPIRPAPAPDVNRTK